MLLKQKNLHTEFNCFFFSEILTSTTVRKTSIGLSNGDTHSANQRRTWWTTSTDVASKHCLASITSSTNSSTNCANCGSWRSRTRTFSLPATTAFTSARSLCSRAKINRTTRTSECRSLPPGHCLKREAGRSSMVELCFLLYTYMPLFPFFFCLFSDSIFFKRIALKRTTFCYRKGCSCRDHS